MEHTIPALFGGNVITATDTRAVVCDAFLDAWVAGALDTCRTEGAELPSVALIALLTEHVDPEEGDFFPVRFCPFCGAAITIVAA